jgi:hypothetical protein
MPSPFVELDVGGRTVKVTNPDKVYFAERGETKLDHVEYYIAVGEGIVRALYERPTQLSGIRAVRRAKRSTRSACPKSGPTGSRSHGSRSRRAGTPTSSA